MPGSGEKNGLLSTSSQIQRVAVDPVRSDLHQRAADRHAGDDLARDRAGGHAHGRLARRGAPAAAVVADAVLLPIGEVGVAGPELVLDVGVVLAALVDVVDDKRDRACRSSPAGRLVGEHAREDAHAVGLAALRGEARLARAGACREKPGCRRPRAGCAAGSRRRRSRSPARGSRPRS